MLPTKQEEEKLLEKKEEKKTSTFSSIPPIVWIVAIVVIILAWNSMQYSKNSTSIIIIIAVIVVVFILLRGKPKFEDKMLTPREAILYVERDLELAKQWGLIPQGSYGTIDLARDMPHIDERGTHYNIGVTIHHPFDGDEQWIAKVGAKGEEKTHVNFIKAIGEFTGREVRHQKNVVSVPSWVRRAKEYPTLERLWGLR